jgi:hypothetical protein
VSFFGFPAALGQVRAERFYQASFTASKAWGTNFWGEWLIEHFLEPPKKIENMT